MALIVQKYGGTSVGNVERINNVADRIINEYKKGNQMVVVVSAMGDTTDKLIELMNQITNNPDPRERRLPGGLIRSFGSFLVVPAGPRTKTSGPRLWSLPCQKCGLARQCGPPMAPGVSAGAGRTVRHHQDPTALHGGVSVCSRHSSRCGCL